MDRYFWLWRNDQVNTRTDMAHEALQRCPELSGVEEENESKGRMRISRIRVRTAAAERKLDKPRGSYITLTLPKDGLSSKAVRREAGRCLAAELSILMGEVQSVLVVGLGNRHCPIISRRRWRQPTIIFTSQVIASTTARTCLSTSIRVA